MKTQEAIMEKQFLNKLRRNLYQPPSETIGENTACPKVSYITDWTEKTITKLCKDIGCVYPDVLTAAIPDETKEMFTKKDFLAKMNNIDIRLSWLSFLETNIPKSHKFHTSSSETEVCILSVNINITHLKDKFNNISDVFKKYEIISIDMSVLAPFFHRKRSLFVYVKQHGNTKIPKLLYSPVKEMHFRVGEHERFYDSLRGEVDAALKVYNGLKS